jgi:MFS transporter, DHA2 family, multidrug resistance protein
MTAVSTANPNPTVGDETVVSSHVGRDVRAVFTHPALGILGVLTAGLISVLSGQLLSVGIADVRAGMRLGVDEASWIPTVYNMALIFMGILSVHLGTIFGQRKVLLVASAVAASAFLLAPLAATRPQLMFLLAVAGLGVGTFYPLILGYMLRALPLPLAVFGLAVYVIDVLVPSFLGNWIEGIISNYFTWRWIFWTPALVIPFVFVFVYFGIPRADTNYGGERPNFAGFFYAAWGFAFLYGAIDQGERLDWFESGTFAGLLLAAVLMFGAMAVRRLWMPNPLVRFRFLNDRNLILLGALLLLFRLSLLTTNLLIPTFLSGVADYRPLQTGQVLWWGLIPQVVVAPLVVILLVKLDVRLLLAAGFALAAAACLMFGRINPLWSDVDFFNPLILQTVGQPFIVVALVFSILLLVVAKGGPKKPWELATTTTFFQTVRLLGGAITAAVMKHFITVQNKFHAMVVTDNLQPGDWRAAEHLRGFAMQAAAGGGAPQEQAAQASRLTGAFIKQQVLTLTVADGFYFIGEAMVVCLILVAVLRAMPLALPAEGQ